MRGSSLLSSLFAIERVCGGSSPPFARVFQIFFLSHFFVGYCTCVVLVYLYQFAQVFQIFFCAGCVGELGLSPLSHFFAGYCTCVVLVYLYQFARVFEIFFPRWMPIGTRFESSISLLCWLLRVVVHGDSVLSLTSLSAIACVWRFISTICFKPSFLVGFWCESSLSLFCRHMCSGHRYHLHECFKSSFLVGFW
jgi:hypothetical protein